MSVSLLACASRRQNDMGISVKEGEDVATAWREAQVSKWETHIEDLLQVTRGHDRLSVRVDTHIHTK